MDLPFKTLEWVGDAPTGHLRLLDQTRLPGELAYLDCHDVPTLHQAIQRLVVRGAPAIGVAAAYGCVLGARQGRLDQAAEQLVSARPTAVNLAWAVRRMQSLGTQDPGPLLEEARAIHREDQAMCLAIGRAGLSLLKAGCTVLTHCNAGALATAGIGTATAPLYLAHQQGLAFRVLADETRPLLQGSRLTAWELAAAGIDVTVLCDDMAAAFMQKGQVDLVITGADRIAANGDTANKIGTYNLAVLAHHHGIPFYVAAPASTFDPDTSSGADIPIEQRDPVEVTGGFGRPTAPPGVAAANPAFDVTPARLISALVTDRGLVRPVNEHTIARVLAGTGG